jgi:hypothetical protein
MNGIRSSLWRIVKVTAFVLASAFTQGGVWANSQTQQTSTTIVRVDPVALLRGAAKLRATNDPVLRDFGWSATLTALTSMKFSLQTVCLLETKAINERSLNSLTVLEVIYKNAEKLGALRLGQPAAALPTTCRSDLSDSDNAAAFLVAATSTPQSAFPNVDQLLSGSRRLLAEIAQGKLTLPQGYSNSTEFMALSPLERGVAARLFALKRQPSDSTLSEDEITQSLAQCALELGGKDQPTLAHWVSDHCAAQLKAPTAATMSAVEKVTTDQPALVAATPSPVTPVWSPPSGAEITIGSLLSAYGVAQNLAGSCPTTNFSRVWNGPVTSGVSSQVGGIWVGATARMLADSSVIAGGSIFEPIAVGPDEPDTPGVPSTAFGIRHRTWGQSGSVRFNVRVTYRPAAGALAIAFRYKCYNVSPTGACSDPKSRVTMACIQGCAADSLLEPGTGWLVFPIADKRVLDLRLSLDSCLETTAACGGPKNSLIPRIFEETMETIEIGGREQYIFGKVDPAVLPDVDGSRVQNGLLTYIAALVRESEPGGWIAPEAAQIERAAMLSKVRVSVLRRLADLPSAAIEKNLRPELLDLTSDLYIRSPWRERQKSLGIFLPFLRQKLDLQYRDSLAAGIASAAVGLDDLKEAHKQLTISVHQLGSMSLSDLDRVIQGAAETLHQPKPASNTTNQEVLEAAVVGASTAVESALQQILTGQQLRCDLWSGLDWNHLPNDELKRVTDEFCGSFRAH